MQDLPKSRALRHAARGGGYLSRIRHPLTASADTAHYSDAGDGLGLRIAFEMRSGGGGDSAVIVWIAPDDFGAVARLMMGADPAAAQRAFGQALVADAKNRKP